MLLSRQWVKSAQVTAKERELLTREFPERVIQIGEGKFLRGFVDWMLHRLNQAGKFQGSVVVVAPRPTGHAKIQQFNCQDGLYTVWLQGIADGKTVDHPELVSSVSRAIDPYTDWDAFLACAQNKAIDIFVSNTTEAGITYQPQAFEEGQPIRSYPGKLTAYLYRRYQYFAGAADAGMTVIPCELIEGNGHLLREIVLQYAKDWVLPAEFTTWVQTANYFCNTLVDRIVTGFPADDQLAKYAARLDYEDALLTIGEPFHLWAMEAPERLQQAWPLDELGLNVKYVDDIRPYWLQKVRILNGSHTAIAYVGHLSGFATVREAMADTAFGDFIRALVDDEILPVVEQELPSLTKQTLRDFTRMTLERFENPFLEHRLLDITFNGLTKFTVRLLPVLKRYAERDKPIPPGLSLCFAALLVFYRDAAREGTGWSVSDDPDKLAQLSAAWDGETIAGLAGTVQAIFGLTQVWGQDLNLLHGLHAAVTHDIEVMRDQGIQAAVAACESEDQTMDTHG